MSEKKNEQFWRDATADDVARVMKGEKVYARFRDDDTEHWIESLLQGWRCDSAFKWLGLDAYFCNCQVYDPPKKQSATPTIKVCDPLEIGAQYAQADRDFRKFVDKAQAGELSFTCTFLWDGNEFIRVKVGDRIQHPNGCCIDITETGFKVNATLDTVEFGK